MHLPYHNHQLFIDIERERLLLGTLILDKKTRKKSITKTLNLTKHLKAKSHTTENQKTLRQSCADITTMGDVEIQMKNASLATPSFADVSNNMAWPATTLF